MRIAIVGTDLCAVDSRGGGLEHALLRWSTFLTARHDVIVVSHRRGPAGIRADNTIDVERTADLAPALRKLRPDIVSLHNRPGWVDLCPRRARAAVTFHNYPTAWRHRGALPVDAMYSAVSATLAASIPRDVTVTPPSIAPEFFTRGTWHHLDTVLFPHRLMRKKGIGELLRVATRPELAGVRFLFADLLSPWLRPTAEHRALRAAIGAVPNAELFAPVDEPAALADLYRSAGVVACPAVEPEGLGLVPLEAQACGAPVVTTDLGGLRDATFRPNRCVPPGDPDALVDALVAALARRRGSTAARRAVEQRHAPDVSGALYESWLLA